MGESNQRPKQREMANCNKVKILITTKIVTTLYPSLPCTEVAGLQEEPQELTSQQPLQTLMASDKFINLVIYLEREFLPVMILFSIVLGSPQSL